MTGLVEFRMPDVGEGIVEAELLEWFVEVGDTVQSDALLCQVQTDKSIVEIPVPATGTLLRRCVEVGDVALVGELLVVIGDPGALPQTQDTDPLAVAADSTGGPSAPVIAELPVRSNRPLASPRVRRLAVQRGIDLAGVVGSGPHHRILETDLDVVLTTDGGTASVRTSRVVVRTPEPRTSEVVPIRGLRRSIARSMTEALTIPHVSEFREVDATQLLAARAALKPSFEARGARLSVFPLLLKAVMRALAIQPSMNATFDAASETLTTHAGVNLGVATATDDGLIVPVVRDADLLSLTELAQDVERLADRARTRTATPEELTGGSFTVTNFGSFGTWLGNPVIRPPEVGIAGFGRITDKVIAINGQPVVRPVLPIVVATDHRVNDGAHLAQFVNALADAVAQPLLLLS